MRREALLLLLLVLWWSLLLLPLLLVLWLLLPLLWRLPMTRELPLKLTPVAPPHSGAAKRPSQEVCSKDSYK